MLRAPRRSCLCKIQEGCPGNREEQKSAGGVGYQGRRREGPAASGEGRCSKHWLPSVGTKSPKRGQEGTCSRVFSAWVPGRGHWYRARYPSWHVLKRVSGLEPAKREQMILPVLLFWIAGLTLPTLAPPAPRQSKGPSSGSTHGGHPFCCKGVWLSVPVVGSMAHEPNLTSLFCLHGLQAKNNHFKCLGEK